MAPLLLLLSLAACSLMAQGREAHIRWSARIADPVLSTHQRFVARTEIEVDGAELAKRRGKGHFIMLVQFEDEQGHKWETHDSIDLAQVSSGFKSSDAIYLQNLFILPGNYTVSFSVADTATGEYANLQRKLHVGPLKNDPLPDSWKGLPAVEFITRSKSPDNWYLPLIAGKLALKSQPREASRIDLIVNLDGSELFSSSSRFQNRNMAALLPTVKILSAVDWGSADFNVSLIDLYNRRVAFEQQKVHEFNWDEASESLAETNPGIVDIKSLENRKLAADFFVRQVQEKIGKSPGLPHIVIVLSSPVAFEPGMEMHPIEVVPRADYKVFYLRYQGLPMLPFSRGGRAGPRFQGGPLIDELEGLFKPAAPKVFDVQTPEQVRKALAALLSEIGRL